MERGLYPADLIVTHARQRQKIQSHGFGIAELGSVAFISDKGFYPRSDLNAGVIPWGSCAAGK